MGKAAHTMKDGLLTLGIIVLFFLVGFSGCIDEDQVVFDIYLPSESTGVDGTLAVRIRSPLLSNQRYEEGAPIIIFVPGGYEVKGVNTDFPETADDFIIVSFVFPGGTDTFSNLSSDGIYDYRGEHCIKALRDVILFCAGETVDDQGRTIDEILPVDIIHENIGMIGISNGGNLPVAVAASYGEQIKGYVKYIIQWETPVNSQIACRDLGQVVLNWTTVVRGDYGNPYYESYQFPQLHINYSNIAYEPGNGMFQIFHDGNHDGSYTTVTDHRGVQTPDVNNNGVIDSGEDFPLSNYTDGTKFIYSQMVTKNLASNNVFNGNWPNHIATVAEANIFWNQREAVVLYDDALNHIPTLEAMILCSINDHVQKEPGKPHVHLAFDGWRQAGSDWVKINPDKPFLVEADQRLVNRSDLPKTTANVAPANWTEVSSYCYPENIYDGVVELAAVYEMADRVQSHTPGK